MPTNGQQLRKSAAKFAAHVGKIETNCANKTFAKSQIDKCSKSFATAALMQTLIAAIDAGMTADVIFTDAREYSRDLAFEKFRRLYSLRHGIVSNQIAVETLVSHFDHPDSDDFSLMKPSGIIDRITDNWCRLIQPNRVMDAFNRIYSTVSPSRCVREIEYWVIAHRGQITNGLFDSVLPTLMAFHKDPHKHITSPEIARRIKSAMKSSPYILMVSTSSATHIPLEDARKSVSEIIRRRRVGRSEMWNKHNGGKA